MGHVGGGALRYVVRPLTNRRSAGPDWTEVQEPDPRRRARKRHRRGVIAVTPNDALSFSVAPLSSTRVPIRRLLLALVLFGALGLLAELLLLGHYDSPWKLAPLAVLVAAIGTGAAAWRSPGARTIGAFRIVMLACVVVGAVGLALHYDGNLEFARERDPELSGLALLWKGLRGATPALAPGALAQLGLLGLVFAHDHPARARVGHRPSEET